MGPAAIKIIKAAAWMGALAFLSACSGVKAPTISVTGATVGERTDEAFVVDFQLDLANPNRQPLELYEFRYEVSVNGRSVYDGRRSAEAVLAADGAKSLSIPAVIPLAERAADDASYTLRGRLWYVTPDALAQILFDSGVNRPKVSFVHEGDLPSPGVDR